MASRQISFFAQESAPDTGIAGLDEAGRGCLAGPVVAAAVVLPGSYSLEGLADSKKLTSATRERLATRIKAQALGWAIGFASSRLIDRINILNASLLAMARAVARLPRPPSLLLVDGNRIIPASFIVSRWPWPEPLPRQRAIVHGDALEPAISAASILAKTARDALLSRMAERWPGYGFEQHKGYGVKKHLEALKRLGPCPAHRLTFRGVRPEVRGRV